MKCCGTHGRREKRSVFTEKPEKGDPVVVIESITPKVAKVYLNTSDQTPRIWKARAKRFADDMRKGNWVLVHSGIAFGNDGRLIDGAHRLAAIVESGVTVQMVVTRYVVKDQD